MFPPRKARKGQAVAGGGRPRASPLEGPAPPGRKAGTPPPRPDPSLGAGECLRRVPQRGPFGEEVWRGEGLRGPAGRTRRVGVRGGAARTCTSVQAFGGACPGAGRKAHRGVMMSESHETVTHWQERAGWRGAPGEGRRCRRFRRERLGLALTVSVVLKCLKLLRPPRRSNPAPLPETALLQGNVQKGTATL